MTDKKEMNLYKFTGSNHEVFFVVAETSNNAIKMAEEQWDKWKYIGHFEGVKIELVAQGKQYPKKGVSWLLIEGG
jgi:hypothetical protein